MGRMQADPIRVVVVDDSPTVQDLLVALLQNAEHIQVVGSASNGEDAVRIVKRLRPDVVTMDISMPRMDGLQAIRHIMSESPTRIVVVSGSLMQADVNPTFDALEAGALAAIRTPGLADPSTCEKLVNTVRLMSDVPVVRRWKKRGTPRKYTSHNQIACEKPKNLISYRLKENYHELKLIAIAASTGGPGTLSKILKPLSAGFPLPILVVQHVTTGFGAGMAEWLNGETDMEVRLARHGEKPQAGKVLLAPDDYHTHINANGEVELSREAAHKGIRPSANCLFGSLAISYGSQAMGIILTGMGDDGVTGLLQLRQAGGHTFAQDEDSCVVFGMPKEAIKRQSVDHILSLGQIADLLQQIDQCAPQETISDDG